MKSKMNITDLSDNTESWTATDRKQPAVPVISQLPRDTQICSFNSTDDLLRYFFYLCVQSPIYVATFEFVNDIARPLFYLGLVRRRVGNLQWILIDMPMFTYDTFSLST